MRQDTPQTAALASRRRLHRNFGMSLLLAALLGGCAETPAAQDAGTAEPASAPAPSAQKSAVLPEASSTASAKAKEGDTQLASDKKTDQAFDAAGFRSAIEKLSEPDGEFFSDNYISNETSYLQVAEQLPEVVPTGGAYVGVGPEQNFTYIALTQPELAFIVDVRRDNMVLHLMYKAIFDLAQDRAHFLGLLTGRDYAPGQVDVPSLAEALKVVGDAGATEASFKAAHAAIRERIEKTYGIALDATDRRSLRQAHRAFFEGGLDIRFKLNKASWRKYPSLRELVEARSPAGKQRGFLASDELFRRVQKMHREHRIIPVVGNFGGDRTFPALAGLLKERNLTLRSFYVSNVEQYLMVDGLWPKWKRNVAALPVDERSVFIRGYLDQGREHPQQMPGHRTATTLHRIQDFNARKRPYGSMYLLSTDGVIGG